MFLGGNKKANVCFEFHFTSKLPSSVMYFAGQGFQKRKFLSRKSGPHSTVLNRWLIFRLLTPININQMKKIRATSNLGQGKQSKPETHKYFKRGSYGKKFSPNQVFTSQTTKRGQQTTLEHCSDLTLCSGFVVKRYWLSLPPRRGG